MSLKQLALVSGLLTIWSHPTQAHDIYSHLTDDLGRSCCNGTDCQPAHYRLTAQGVQMLIGERWIEVPEETIMYRALPGDSGRTGGGHWCGSELAELYGPGHIAFITKCAILPPQSVSASHTTHQ